MTIYMMDENGDGANKIVTAKSLCVFQEREWNSRLLKEDFVAKVRKEFVVTGEML